MSNMSSSCRYSTTVMIVLGISSALSAQEQGAWRSVIEPIGLLSQGEVPSDIAASRRISHARVKHWEEQAGRRLRWDEQALLERGADGAWKTFSDDFVQFDLPDDPLLTVESFVPADNPQLPVVGGVMSTVDNTFERVYRLMFSDGQPYATILVAENNWFDEGVCFCGPISLTSFSLAHGQLYEFSQMPHGWIKKIQVINDTHRAMLFEWTHSVITQATYVRIGTSLRFHRTSNRTRAEWIALTKAKRGFEAGINWLQAGTSVDEIQELLGSPSQSSDDQLVYVRETRDRTGRGERTTIRLPIRAGHLVPLDANWRVQEDLDAPRGSSVWIEDQLSKWFNEWYDQSVDLDESKRPSLPRDDVKLILDMFHTHAPSAQGEEWNNWCSVIMRLAELGVADRTAADLVARRCVEEHLPQSTAFAVLDHYQIPEELELVRMRLSLLLSESEIAECFRSECAGLFDQLQAKDEESAELLRRGITNEIEEIRAAAAYFLSKLPREEARRLLRANLSDPSQEVRGRATHCISELCTQDDKVWLQEILQRETDPWCRERLEQAIADLPAQ